MAWRLRVLWVYIYIYFFLIFIFCFGQKAIRNFYQILSMASESPKVPKPVSYRLAEATKICRVQLKSFGIKSRIVSQHSGGLQVHSLFIAGCINESMFSRSREMNVCSAVVASGRLSSESGATKSHQGIGHRRKN